MRVSARKVVLLVALGTMACMRRPELRADPLDPDAFASQGIFDPTTQGTYTIEYDSKTNTPSIMDPNGKTVATGVVYDGINVFDFDSISITSASTNIIIAGRTSQGYASGPTAFLSRGDISVMSTAGNGYVFDFNGVGTPGPYGPGAGGNGNPFTSPVHPSETLYTGGGGGGFGTAGSSVPDNLFAAGGKGGMTYGDLSKQLEGGSGGGDGGLFERGGAGGGAIELGALGTVTLVGSGIEANGADGGYLATPSGPGGGGSGGGIFIHAPTVSIDNAFSSSGSLTVYGGAGAGFGGLGRILIETNNPLGDTSSYPVKPLAVPEPGSGLLVGLGFASLMFARRLRRKAG